MAGDVLKKTLTDRFLKSLKPLKSSDPGYRRQIWDADPGAPGLCVRPGGHVSFYNAKHPKGSKQTVWTWLGNYPALSLSAARLRSTEVSMAIADGKSVPVPVPGGMTLADAIELYIEKCLDQKRTRVEIEQLFRSKVIPGIGRLPITAVRHEDVVTLLRGIADRAECYPSGRIRSGGPHSAHKTLVHLKGFFQWAVFDSVGGLKTNPTTAIPAKELLRNRTFNRTRDRVLDDDELRAIWQAAERIGYPFGTLIMSLILTGQRLNEIARARWCEIVDGALEVPPERMKNKRPHSLPLTPRMRKLVGSLPNLGPNAYLFTTTGGARPISGFSKSKAALDRMLEDVAPWQLHDIRRSTRTGLASAGVPVFDAELIVAHQQSGVHGTYDRHRYQAEKLAGLLKWEAKLAEILEPPPDNVVEMPERARA
jgi:integrase